MSRIYRTNDVVFSIGKLHLGIIDEGSKAW